MVNMQCSIKKKEEKVSVPHIPKVYHELLVNYKAVSFSACWFGGNIACLAVSC